MSASIIEFRRPYSDRTADRLRAYLASMRPLRGSDRLDEDDDYQAGRALVERMALSPGDDDTDQPALRLSADECVQVLQFMACTEPVDREAWWTDPKESPSHLAGFYMVLRCLQDSICDFGRQPARERT